MGLENYLLLSDKFKYSYNAAFVKKLQTILLLLENGFKGSTGTSDLTPLEKNLNYLKLRE